MPPVRAWVFLALVTQLFPLVHMGVVRHDICVEHDELIERAGAGDGRHDSLHVDPHDDGQRDARASNEERGGDHDHCELGFLPGLLPTVSAPLVVERVVVIEAPPVPRQAVRPVDPLMRAPKHGPPTV
jgi:hypothetical protein